MDREILIFIQLHILTLKIWKVLLIPKMSGPEGASKGGKLGLGEWIGNIPLLTQSTGAMHIWDFTGRDLGMDARARESPTSGSSHARGICMGMVM